MNREVHSSVCCLVFLCSNLKQYKIIKTAYCPFYVTCSFLGKPDACITHNAASPLMARLMAGAAAAVFICLLQSEMRGRLQSSGPQTEVNEGADYDRFCGSVSSHIGSILSSASYLPNVLRLKWLFQTEQEKCNFNQDSQPQQQHAHKIQSWCIKIGVKEEHVWQFEVLYCPVRVG